ncbi:early nodulin-like protein 1 [Abrus precatorius]|uniref:Early nodulin-like protein 1 n=1 Tax=Abrus precatorius TaxID=3816 RepID=A0A8B8KRE7_ABRPR|nr:early nodulin-like protein 1 [Abrus precatorius]
MHPSPSASKSKKIQVSVTQNRTKMLNLTSPSPRFNRFLACLLVTLLQIQTKVLCYQFKVGDLHAWGIPTSLNSQVYDKWSKYHNLTIGDSLLFLYPPSQDSVIQVTEESYKSCNLKDPILYMNNGNSLFNITSEGNFYFTSGEPGHCQKNQKLRITVGVGGNVNALSPTSLPANAPSYPTVFGTIPMSPSSTPQITSNFSLLIIGLFVCAISSLL